MYTQFFRFSEAPFSITPDPAFLYLSPRHHEALAHLLYGTGESGGFVQLTGEVGTGKTTVIRTLLQQKMDDVDVALILNPRQSVGEFLQSICDELGIAYAPGATTKPLVDALNRYLLSVHAQGKRTVLIVDEAQNLSEDLLEQIRLLTNLETDKQKLLRIMLIGQPELDELLTRPSLRQLAQRVTARFHLTALDRDETAEYIAHRLRVVGGDAELFDAAAIRAVYNATQGIPRLINVLCDRALLAAYSAGTRRITTQLVRDAARETLPRTASTTKRHWPRIGWIPGVAVAGMLLAAFGWTVWNDRQETSAPSLPTPDTQARVSVPDSADATVVDAALPEPPIEATEMAPVPEEVADVPEHPALDATELMRRTPPLGEQVAVLAGLWESDLRLPDNVPVCEALTSAGLRCLRERGDWQDLLRFDRPAILTMITASAAQRYVLLRAITENTATVVTEAGLATVARDTLDLFWNGEYLLFWRIGRDFDVLRAGDTGPDVDWVRQVLTGAAPPQQGHATLDAALQQRVRAFQSDIGLVEDGHVGDRTHLMLMQLAQPDDGPVLQPENR